MSLEVGNIEITPTTLSRFQVEEPALKLPPEMFDPYPFGEANPAIHEIIDTLDGVLRHIGQYLH